MKKLLPVFLALFLIVAFAAPSFAADPESVQAVYLGVVDYGGAQTTNANKDNFQYYFAVGDQVVTYKISNANGYAINNIMAEGYVFDLTVQDGIVIAATIPVPSVSGTIQTLGAESIVVAGQKVAITENTKIYQITTQAGGATVAPATLEVGKTVKVYGNVIYLTFVAQPYEAPLKGVAGQRTIKNFLATAFEPVGSALYIYGGTWDWQDVGSSNQATTIGLAQTWVDFFQSQDENFLYRNNADYSKSYYPHRAYNEYYYAGVDCSGYVGWVMYNVLNTENGNSGYVMASTQMANNYANVRGFGTHSRTFASTSFEDTTFHPGDIFSMSGHTWMVVGVCEDGSILIMHSTPSDSKTGFAGGGAQLTGIRAQSGPGSEPNCQAHQLAVEYMRRYYPAWSERYTPIERTYSGYVNLSTSQVTGKFSWHLDERGATDPDGYMNMTADEILADLFGENVQETNLRLKTDRSLVEAGDYFRVKPNFNEAVSSNAATLDFTYDKDKFLYRGFTPAEGVLLLQWTETNHGVKLVVMAPGYNITEFGELTFSAKEDVDLEKDGNQITVSADYVVKLASGTKEVKNEVASTSIIRRGDIDLIVLSNLIDVFGIKSNHPDWIKYRGYDYNNNGEIDIFDISTVASKLL